MFEDAYARANAANTNPVPQGWTTEAAGFLPEGFRLDLGVVSTGPL